MKRTLSAITAALAALLLVVAAPALSSRPYQPPPVDFEMAAPVAALHTAGSGSAVTSRPLRAPKRFNVVGLRWSGRSEPRVHVRAREAGGAWSPWRALGVESDHNPDPRTGEPSVRGVTDAAWAGDADYVQYRLSRPVAGLRLHFVNTLGTATAADRLKTAIRDSANHGVIAAAALFGARDAVAASPQPAIVPRSGWGAKDCVPRSSAQYGQVKAAFVHHTVTLNDYTAQESPSIVLGICRYHRNSNGWNDVGYNFLVDKYGTIFEGRAGGIARPVVGAQAEGFNSQSTGIANLGDFSDVPQSAAALDAMAKLIRWKLPLEGAPTAGRVRLTSAGGSTNRYAAGTSALFERISGHRDGNNTACPGNALYAQLPELRRLAGNVQPDGATEPAPTASTRLRLAAPAVVEVPADAVVTGALETTGGRPVAGQPVAIQVLRGGSWRPVAQAVTDGGGAFEASVPTSTSAVLRAVFVGAAAYKRSTSNRAAVGVRPDLTLKSPGARLPTGGRVRLRGGIKPAKARVGVVLERKLGKRYRRVSLTRVNGARGRFGLTVRPRASGLYRAYARFGGDSANVSGRSPYAYFRLARSAAGGVSAPRR